MNFAILSASWQHGVSVQLRAVHIGGLRKSKSRDDRETTAAQIVGHIARICDPNGSWQHGARVQLRVFHIGALLEGNLASEQRRKQVT